MAEGVATAWHAGELPHSARGQYSAMIQSASSSFAEGKLLLVMAILSAIVAYVTRGQVKNSLLVQQLGKSRLGPRFAEWVGANRDKLLAHPKLQPKPPAGAAERKPAGSQGGKAPEAEKPTSPDKPEKKGKAERPCPVAPGAPLVAAPVSPITGAKILAAELDLDFALPAPLPLIWQRVYSSDARRGTWLGQGWSLPISDWLRITADEVVLIDPFERDITFSLPRVGQSIHSPSEQITLLRSDEHSFELIDPDGLRTLFATLGGGDVARLTGWIDANNNHIKIEYDARQLPVRIEDSAGRTYALEFGQYRGTPRLAGVSLVQPGAAPETLVRYEFDAAGNLQRVRNRAGDITRQFAYRNHMMVEHSQPDGLVSRYEYDVEEPEGKVTRTWTNTGQWWELRYLAQETIVTDNLGREQRYRFDARRRYVGLVDAAGGVTTRELDEDGHLLALTDPGGRSIRYHYDTRGRVIRVERGGRGTGIVYDSRFDKPALITDALGHTTALRYDGFGNLVSVTNALGQRTSYQYDGRGLPIKVTDARGGVKRLDYNNAGQLISYTDCSNNTSSFSYDAQGRLVRALDANGHASTYQYDALGRLTSATHADGSVERYEYDALGRLVGHIDPAGHRTSYTLDADGKPLKRIDARGGVLEYRYDDARRIAELINENGDAHRFVYDVLDRLAEETTFDARLTRYRYDDSGLIVAKVEHGTVPRSEMTRIDTAYLRDSLGQLTEKVISRVTGLAQAQQMRLRFAYDALGRMTQAINADATVSMEYDALGQLVAEQTEAFGSTTQLRHAYDELGNRVQTVLPDGRVLNNLYYGSGHLHQINLDGEVITDIERDRTHRMISRTQGALTSQFEYDPVGRLVSQMAGKLEVGQSVEPLIARKYEYDQAGNLVSIDDKRNGVTRYSYDVIGRILSAVQPNLEERFAFDPAHNIMDATTAKVGRVEGNRVRVFEDKRYDYDAHGNVVEKLIGKHTKMRFEWNAAHQMVKSVVARNSSDAVQTVRYFYDPFGRRIGKRDAFGTTRFVWDGNRLQCETRGSHDRTYVYDTGTFVPLAQLDNLVRCDATVTHSSISYLQTDHLGTPREVTSSAGDVLWTAQYRTWGTVCSVVTASAPETLSSDDAVMALQPIRFQGQYFDEETSLHHNNFRYYDPDIGRFISVDPIGLAGGLNNFRYAPNPTTWIDPLGLKCEGHSAPQTDGNSANGKSSGRSFWPRQTTFEEITVYPRDDIFDPNLVTEWRAGGKIVTGSNVERMATGRAPIGTDGKPVNLHHMLQSNDSAIAELTQTFHQQNSKIIHINPNTIPSGVDRAAFDAWKSRYWANRSTEFIPK